MRIVVSEFVCGGGWPEEVVPESLAREGRAMWEAVVRDLAALPGMSVLTTWDSRLGQAPSLEVCPKPMRVKSRADTSPVAPSTVVIAAVDGPQQERRQLRRFVRQADAAIIIAPELDDALAVRCQEFQCAGLPLLNSSLEAIRLCSDKLRLFHLLHDHGFPTIPTAAAVGAWPGAECVLKRRDGAGSMGMRRIGSRQEFDAFQMGHNLSRFVIQPYRPGRALSVAAIFDRGQAQHILPVAEQILSQDGQFTYLSGAIPAPADVRQLHDLVTRAGQCVGGLHGYVGFDLLAPDGRSDSVLLVEINPRLTTSYIGYREICDQNLGNWIVDPAREPAPTFSGSVRFSAAGIILEKTT